MRQDKYVVCGTFRLKSSYFFINSIAIGQNPELRLTPSDLTERDFNLRTRICIHVGL